MPAERFYCPSTLSLNATIVLEDEQCRHMIKVMRNEVGDCVELINGKGQHANARITAIGKHSATLSIETLTEVEPEPYRLILAQALPKLNRLDTIAEKATELGITELWLFPGVNSEKLDLSANQQTRLQGIFIASIKQCGRLHLPAVKLCPPLKQWTSPLPCDVYYGDVDPSAPLFHKAWKEDARGCIFVVGPESGLSRDEEKQLRKLSAKGVKLHSNILRTDTASIMALSLVSHWQLNV